MLARLSIRDIVLIERLDIEFSPRPRGADRRDRRGQIDPARCLRAGARRPRRRRPGAPRRRAGPGHRRVRRAAKGHPARAILADNGIDDAGETDPAPRATRRRPHPRLHQRPAGQRADAEGASARRWSRSTASTTSARWSMPRRIAPARCLCRAGEGRRGASRRCGMRAAPPRMRSTRIAPSMERAAREADYLRHAADELQQARRRRPARKPRWPSAAPP